MTGIYLGTIIFFIGAIMTIIINRNVEVPMGGDFWDMPTRVKSGILLLVLGILLVCGSVMFLLLTNPIELLNRGLT